MLRVDDFSVSKMSDVISAKLRYIACCTLCFIVTRIRVQLSHVNTEN